MSLMPSLATCARRRGLMRASNSCLNSASEAEGEPAGVPGEAQPFYSESFGFLHQEGEDGGVEVEVQVAVDVIEGEAGGAKFLELGLDFAAQLFAQVALEKIAPAGPGRV